MTMYEYRSIQIAVLYLFALGCCVAMQIMKLEAEHYVKNFIYRQSASQDKTVSLQENDAMTIPFCLRRRTYVAVSDVLYTNDGLANTVRITIDWKILGQFTTHNMTNEGTLWNRIVRSGQVGEPLSLRSGHHQLRIHVLSGKGAPDEYGMEIDAILLAIEDSEISSHYLHCLNTMCNDLISYKDRHRDRDDIPSGKIIQMSRPSQCLEEDNIKIPLYHDNIRQFRISAMPPRYRTFWTFKNAQFEGCPEYSQYHWQYLTVDCTNTSEVRTHRNSILTLSNTSDSSLCRLLIQFDLEGMSYGKTDAHIGDILEIGILPDSDQTLELTPKYSVTKDGTTAHTNTNMIKIDGDNTMGSWSIPDFTWAEMSFGKSRLNELVVDIPSNAVLNFIRLKRRLESLPVMQDIYQSNHVKIQKVEFDFWWRDPEIHKGNESDMEIYITYPSKEVFVGTADYIVFIENRVWAAGGDMDHTFVLYQDGSARILPIVPHGLESYIPFGNDIVIGQSDPFHMRPHAPIKKLVLKPEDHSINVHYQDGGFATLHIFAGIKETNITVTNISFAESSKNKPFAIFRSTWVEDGRAKVDHVSVNGLPAHHILLDGWTTLYGTNYVFYRKCISVYNSQSPDFSIEIMSDSEVV